MGSTKKYLYRARTHQFELIQLGWEMFISFVLIFRHVYCNFDLSSLGAPEPAEILYNEKAHYEENERFELHRSDKTPFLTKIDGKC